MFRGNVKLLVNIPYTAWSGHRSCHHGFRRRKMAKGCQQSSFWSLDGVYVYHKQWRIGSGGARIL